MMVFSKSWVTFYVFIYLFRPPTFLFRVKLKSIEVFFKTSQQERLRGGSAVNGENTHFLPGLE